LQILLEDLDLVIDIPRLGGLLESRTELIMSLNASIREGWDLGLNIVQVGLLLSLDNIA
jgi:hypothetical protein